MKFQLLINKLKVLAGLTIFAALTKLVFKLRARMKQIKKLAKTYPVPKRMIRNHVSLIFRQFFEERRNRHRIGPYNEELFKEVEQETGERQLTIQNVGPIWDAPVEVCTRDLVLIKYAL